MCSWLIRLNMVTSISCMAVEHVRNSLKVSKHAFKERCGKQQSQEDFGNHSTKKL